MTLERSGGKGRIITGARSRLSFKGKIVGYCRNVTLSENIETEPVDVLDNIRTEEHVPIAYRVNMSASMFRIIGSTLKSEGLFPKSGADSREHLINILTSGELTATVEDTKTGKIYSEVQGVTITSHNWTIDARGIVGEDMEAVGIVIADESEIV